MSDTGIGASVRRKEDDRFLTGRGRYTDDISRPGQTHGYLVRSPVAHARLNGVDTGAALSAPGVVAVLTGEDMAADEVGGVPCGWLVTQKDGTPMIEPGRPPLATGKVRFVGDPVALVVAETRDQASDAAQLVRIDYEDLPAAATLEAASAPGAPSVWDEADDNICFDWEIGDKAATDAAFEAADHVVSLVLRNQRLVPNAIETRSVLGEYDSVTGDYTLFTSSQIPHVVRLLMGAFVLGIPEHKLRIVAPDVGGGFGSKISHYPEEAIVTWAAKRVGRPIKWTADRSEAFLSDTHGRDHISHVELALDSEGGFLGLRVNTKANLGAYLSTFGPLIPTYLYGTLLAGPYTTPAIYCDVQAYFSHSAPVDALRGAGRPEASFMIERVVDTAARELGIDPVAIRRKNFITEFPYQTPVALEYDTGEYGPTLDLALELADYDTFEARREEARSRGKLRGFGISTFLEACGVAPSAVVGALGGRAGLWESGQVRVHPTGSVTVFTGTHSHGQGHETTMAQIVSEFLGMDTSQIDVVHGDTAKTAMGMGTFGSRSAAVGGVAIAHACEKIIAKGKKIAAHLLEASADDMEFENGTFTVAGTDRSKTFGEVALTAYVPHNYPADLEPGLDETAFYDPKNFTYPAGAHAVEVEVDPETGTVELIRVACGDDVGRVINPMIVDGQMHGGLAHGIGQALLENTVYDENGQLLTGSLLDYAIPRADDLPFFRLGMHNTDCTHNSLGVKGVGEVGSIGVPPAVINAVVDAVAHLGVRHIDMPASPERVWRAIQDAKA